MLCRSFLVLLPLVFLSGCGGGRVVNQFGDGLPGVQIYVENQLWGSWAVVTDDDGCFSLPAAASDDATLSFRKRGLKQRSLKVGELNRNKRVIMVGNEKADGNPGIVYMPNGRISQ